MTLPVVSAEDKCARHEPTSIPKIAQRIHCVDVAKGVGIVLVALGHLLQYGCFGFSYIFSFHMPLFFFLSGFCFRQPENWRQLFLRQKQNVIIPYLVILAVGILVTLLIPAWWPINKKYALREILYYFEPTSFHVGQIWFLSALFVTQTLFYFVFHTRRTSFQIWFFSCGTIALGVIFSDRYELPFLPWPLHLPWKADSAFTGLVFFTAGFYAAKAKLIERLRSKPAMLAGIGVIAFALNLVFGPILNGTVNMALVRYNNQLYFYVSAFSGIALVLVVSLLLELSCLLRFLGRNSLPIFGFHSFFMYLYAYLLSVYIGSTYICMENIPAALCGVGTLFIILMSLPVPYVFGRIISVVTRGENRKC